MKNSNKMKHQIPSFRKLIAIAVLFLGTPELYAQCDEKLEDFIELAVEEIPVNIKSILSCVDRIASEIKAQEAPTPKSKPVKKPIVKRNDSLKGENQQTPKDVSEEEEKPPIKKMKPAQLHAKKVLLSDAYGQLISYYQSSGVTDATQAKKYKRLRDNLKLKKE